MGIERLANTAGPGARFTIGRTLTDTLRILFGNLLVFLIPAFVIQFVRMTASPQPVFQAFAGDLSSMSIITWAIWTLGGAIILACVLPSALLCLRGAPARFWDIKRGVRLIPLFALVDFLLSLPAMVVYAGGTFLPGDPLLAWIVFAVSMAVSYACALMWYLAAPVIAVEGCGFLPALMRSRQLLHGHRWRMLVLLTISSIIAYIVYDFIPRWVAIVLPIDGPAIAPVLCVMVALYSAAAVFNSILIAVTYHHLRIDTEGVPAEQLVAVFD